MGRVIRIEWFVALVLIGAQPALAESGDWKKLSQEEGISVFRREVPGSPVLSFKGEGVVDAPILKVASVIFDTTRAPEWVEDLTECKLVRWASPSEFIEYDHFAMPPLVADRDFVSSVRMSAEGGKTFTFLYKNAVDPAVPEVKGFVRGDLMNTTFVLKSEGDGEKTFVTGIIHADPKGRLPKWLVNLIQKDWPVTTLTRLRKQVAKPDVRVEPRVAAILEGKS